MKVKQLRDLLLNLPDDMEIILSKDAEGNHFSPLADYNADSIYVADTTYSGDVYDDSWTADDAVVDEERWQEMLKSPRVLVLWPTN